MSNAISFLITIGFALLPPSGSLFAQSDPGGGSLSFTIRLEDAGSIEVVHLSAEQLARYTALNQDDWRGLFPIYTGSTWPNDDRPQLLGRYEIIDGVVRFTPSFPLEPGLTYIARFHADPTRSPIQTALLVPALERERTIVESVYPSGDVPENLLKFYVHFSGPMQRAGVYDHIQITDARGTRMAPPFVEIVPPLWDSESRRLTLLFEPGRIKRGLRPHEEQGMALKADASFNLIVDAQMRDANGQPLATTFKKSFQTTSVDRQSPQTEDWVLRVPKPGTRHSLIVALNEPLDHTLLQSMIDVYRKNDFVDGTMAVESGETEWRFTPAQIWQEGDYELRINVLLEDLAGNRIDRLFDVDMMLTEERTTKELGEWVTKRFTIP